MKNNDMAFKMKWAREQGREAGYQAGIKFAIEQYSGVVLLCLKDKFDFTTEQLRQATVYINDTFDSVCEDYLSLKDIIDTLKEENDIDFRFIKAEASNE